jgi:hypothetical protein
MKLNYLFAGWGGGVARSNAPQEGQTGNRVTLSSMFSNFQDLNISKQNAYGLFIAAKP